jgi:putative effector of murein hydrolase
MDWLSAFERRPLFAVCLTVAAYAAAEALWRRTGRPALRNPVLVSTTVLAVLLLALGISYDACIRQAIALAPAAHALLVAYGL